MAVRQITVPYIRGYDFGIGADLASGSPMGMAVVGEASDVTQSGGATVNFEVQRIHSTSDLESALGIDVEASYGCGAFGAGGSARFAFAKKSKVQTSSLFMSVTAQIELAFLSIDDPELSKDAGEQVDHPDVFAARYGNMFVRGISRGGLFVGVLRVDTSTAEESEEISAELEGSYGLFSLDAKTKFESVQKQHKSEVFTQMYHEGGPPGLKIDDPADPLQLLKNANRFLESFESKAKADEVARPYLVTLAPLAIARGPLPLNAADLQHAQDVLVYCAARRSALTDQLNLLDYIKDNPSKFDFSQGASREALAEAAGDVQADLDLVAACASKAIDDPSNAKLPAEFAKDRGSVFPLAEMPTPMPLAIGVKNVEVPDFGACNSWGACQELAASSGLAVTRQDAAVPAGDFKVLSFAPPKGALVPEGSPVTVITNPVTHTIDPRMVRLVFNPAPLIVKP